MNHFIEVFENALTDEQCDICIDAVNQDNRSRSGVVNTYTYHHLKNRLTND